VPVVVGIRARTTQFTSGRRSSSRGFFCPQPPLAVLLSTGTDLGGRVEGSNVDEGVEIPGVEGGVN
jgi:hypothetical protein